MIIFRAFWALLLAGLVAYTFHRAWKWEHGAPMPEPIFGADKPRTKETIVWVDPSFLPWLLLVILIMFGSLDGMDGVKRFLSLSLDVMIVISVYFLLLIFLLPVFRRFGTGGQRGIGHRTESGRRTSFPHLPAKQNLLGKSRLSGRLAVSCRFSSVGSPDAGGGSL